MFAAVQEKLLSLESREHRKRLNSIDRTISDALLGEINATREGQTRERLHLAIYEGKLPHYYRGIPEATTDPNTAVRHAWRHLINTLYNFNLAERVNSRPVLNSRWLRIPKRLVVPTEGTASRLEKGDEVRLDTPIYPEFLTVPFVVSVRREADFWTAISKLETAHASGNQTAYESAFKDHLRLVSSLFARHLKDSGRVDLVKSTLAEVWIKLVPKTLFWSAAAEAAIGLWLGLPWNSIAVLVGAALPAQGTATLIVNGLIATLPLKVTNPRFKSFEAELVTIARGSGVS